ncbi:MAG: hypothetical protein AAF745_07330 [Planctomycetota bacterium]
MRERRLSSNYGWSRATRGFGVVLLVVVSSAMPAVADWRDEIGYTALQLELGAATPTGAGVAVSMAEAPTSAGAYMPDVDSSVFSGILFTDVTNTSTGVRGHATTTASHFFGDTNSTAPDVSSVAVFDANDWIDQLGGVTLTSGFEPVTHASYAVQNHSWIVPANSGNDLAAIANLSQRIDHLVNRDGVLIIGGSSNGGSVPHLTGQSYNSILVGNSYEPHGAGQTVTNGVGRQRPDIVAPETRTSRSTPRVASAAAMLHEAFGGTSASHTEVMRAALMAGATKDEFSTWDRTVTRPIDETYGAGELNVYHSYKILDGGEFDGSIVSPVSPVGLYGYDYHSAAPAPSMTPLLYDFHVPTGMVMEELSVFLQWNIDVRDALTGIDDPTGELFSPVVDLSPGGDLADFELTLFDPLGSVIDVSDSPVDNFEHLYLTNLSEGTYQLQVSGDRADTFGLAWRSSLAAISATAVPEPSSVLLLIAMGLPLALQRRTRPHSS